MRTQQYPIRWISEMKQRMEKLKIRELNRYLTGFLEETDRKGYK